MHLLNRLRKPTVYGAIHQQVAEGEHEDEWDEGDKNGSPQHARAEAGSEDAAALVGVKLQDVADEKNENAHEEQKRDGRQRDEDEGLSRGGGVQEVEVEGVESGER